MTDILLTHSYFLRFDPKEFRAMMPYSPLGTLYAASHARSLGFSVALADSMFAEKEDHLKSAIAAHRPSVVVIYDDDFNYLTKMCLKRMREAAFRLCAIARVAGCRVVVHGSDPADHLQEYLDHDAEFVVRGEGEITLGELVQSLLRGNPPLETIRGIAYRENGSVRITEPRKAMKDLDLLPFPARDLVDHERYRAAWKRKHGYYSMNIVTTRGCPYHCNWCAKPIYGQVYNVRTPKNVVDELLSVQSTLHPDHVWFCDDIFGLTPGWIHEFAAEVQARDALIPFKCLGRADLLTDEPTVNALRNAGCTSVWIGAESGSQRVLDAMEKGTTVQQIHESSSLLKRYGIRVGFFLQFGYPGETDEDILLTLRMLKECMPDEIGISVSYPLPGTKFHERVQKDLGDKHNWLTSDDLDLLYPGLHIPDFYRTLHLLTHKRFRIWQGLDILRAIAARPWNVTRGKLRRVASIPYHATVVPALNRRLHTLGKLRRNPVEAAAPDPEAGPLRVSPAGLSRQSPR